MIYLNNQPTLFNSASEVPAWPYRNFNPERFASNGNGEVLVVPSFMLKLQTLRDLIGQPLVISSGYRDPAYNNKISHTGVDGPHTTGRAVDIQAYGELAFLIVSHAEALGFTGIGLKQTEAHSRRFVHLDDLEGDVRPWIWTY